MKNKNINKKAFTLAEVLITLAIIGVVAALTIPSVISNYKKQQIVSKLKKTYSTLSNTIPMAIKDYGSPDSWSYNNVTEFTEKYMIPYLHVQKKCGAYISSQDKNRYTWGYSIQNIAGVQHGIISWSYTNLYRFYLTDGTFVATKLAEDGYITIFIDINGTKNPNKMGQDFFAFDYYLKGNNKGKIGKLKKYKAACDYCEANDYAGLPCGTYIMKKGWRIPTKEEWKKDHKNCWKNKNYPW